jgi:hypothetical protein
MHSAQLWAQYFGQYRTGVFGIRGDTTTSLLWRVTNGEAPKARTLPVQAMHVDRFLSLELSGLMHAQHSVDSPSFSIQDQLQKSFRMQIRAAATAHRALSCGRCHCIGPTLDPAS